VREILEGIGGIIDLDEFLETSNNWKYGIGYPSLKLTFCIFNEPI
jgi:hypothetical protein